MENEEYFEDFDEDYNDEEYNPDVTEEPIATEATVVVDPVEKQQHSSLMVPICIGSIALLVLVSIIFFILKDR